MMLFHVNPSLFEFKDRKNMDKEPPFQVMKPNRLDIIWD